jgi:carbon-monoxide dehydrogenase medium subunit
VLAGGQSLVPLLNMRLSQPELIVDVGRIESGRSVAVSDAGIRVGLGVTQAELLAEERCHPLLRAALRHVGHPQTRNRGTVLGSLAHADPAAELPAAAVALGAVLELSSTRGVRRVEAHSFFVGPFLTVLDDDELLTSVEVRAPAAGEVASFLEVSQGHGDFASAGVACVARLEDGALAEIRLVGFGPTPRPLRLEAAERAGLEAPGLVGDAVLESLPERSGTALARHQLAVAAARVVEGLVR